MTDSCQYDAQALTEPDFPLFTAQCRQCEIRSLAQSPIFHEAKMHNTIAGAYKAQLVKMFGAAWPEGHQVIKHEAGRIRLARATVSSTTER